MSDAAVADKAAEQQQQAVQQEAQRGMDRPADDVDAELAELQAKIEQEQKSAASQGTETEQQAAATEAGTPAQQQQPATTAPAQPAAPQMVPVSVLQKMRAHMQQMAAQNLVLQGQVGALSTLAQSAPQAAQAPQQQAAEVDPLDEVTSKREALAQRFDDGEISMKEFVKQDTELQREIATLAAQAAIPAQQQPMTSPVVYEDLQMEDATAQLAQQYPIILQVTAEDLAPFEALAYKQAALEGTPIQRGARGTIELRRRIAALATQFYGGQAQPQATQTAMQQPAPAANNGQLSPRAQARDAKLQMAASMPPDVSKLGSGATGAPASDAEIAAKLASMTDDEAIKYLDSMPHVKKRILG